jgi:hypothetical protein
MLFAETILVVLKVLILRILILSLFSYEDRSGMLVTTQDNDYDRRKRQTPSRILSFTAVYGVSIDHLVVIVLRPFFVVPYTVSSCRKRPENEVSDRLHSFTIR